MKKFPKVAGPNGKLDAEKLKVKMHQRESGLFVPESARTGDELLMAALNGIVQKCCKDLGVRTVEQLSAIVRQSPPRGFLYPVYVRGGYDFKLVGPEP